LTRIGVGEVWRASKDVEAALTLLPVSDNLAPFKPKGKLTVSNIEKLLIVQEHDCRIREMEQELRDIPARKTAEQSRLEQHKKALADADHALKSRQSETKKIEGDIEALKEKITKLRQQQSELKTNKEFKAMEDEIKGVQRQIASVEDRELGLMEEIEKAKQESQAIKNALGEEESAIQGDVGILDERATLIAQKLDQEKSLRNIAAKETLPDWLTFYDRIFNHRKDKAIVALEDGICGGCHMRLPPAVVHATRKHDAMVVCSYCGRMLH
jgi:uncharacterized protein